jgi:hypothetical protein
MTIGLNYFKEFFHTFVSRDDAALKTPPSYEVEILPQRIKTNSPSRKRNIGAHGMHLIAAFNTSEKIDQLWLTQRKKLKEAEKTSSNLG